MSLFDRLRNLLRPDPPPPTLRNRPGGLARVRILNDHTSGATDMNGCFVTTVRLDGDTFWVLDPPLQFTAQIWMATNSGGIVAPGNTVTVHSMHDDLLVPVPGVGDEERSQELGFQPKVPAPGVPA